MKVLEKMSEKPDVSEKIFNLIKQNSKTSAKNLAEKLAITPRTVEIHLANLKKERRIQRVGSTRHGYWQIDE
jgi:ATP-dependent DNA helicase RecG